MKVTLTNGQVISFHNEVLRMEKTSILSYFLHPKITAWKKENQTVINRTISDYNAISPQFYEHENGQVKKDEKGEGVLLEGKTHEEYNKAREEFLAALSRVEL